MTLLLAADTSTPINAVALCRTEGEGQVALLGESVVAADRRHSERLMATIDWVLGETQHRLAEVGLLAVSVGPGSFTGLRIGVAAFKGLAFATGLPLVGVPTLDALARTALPCPGRLCVLLDARMGEVYGAIYDYDDNRPVLHAAPRVGPVESFLKGRDAPLCFIGDGAWRYADTIRQQCPGAVILPRERSVPRASAVAAEGWARVRTGAGTDAALVAPVYLRPSQAEMNRSKERGTVEPK